MRASGIAAFVFAIGIAQQLVAGTFSFVPGHYYTTSGFFHSASIDEYDAAGNFVASLPVRGASDLSSIRFGPDQKLYVTASSRTSIEVKVDVLAINGQGIVEKRYPSPINNGFGQLAFDDAGHLFQGKVRFELSEPNSGNVFLPHGEKGVAVLPNGNIAAADSQAIYELDSMGNVIREVFRTPLGNAIEVRSLAYDAETNVIYTHYVNEGYKLLKIDFGSGETLNSTLFHTGRDLSLTQEGMLLAGSRGTPRLLTQELETVFSFGDTWQYGTQYVPEPSTLVLAGFVSRHCLSLEQSEQRAGERRPQRAHHTHSGANCWEIRDRCASYRP